MTEPMRFDDEDVTEAFESFFGARLFNLYTLERERAPRLFFSARLAVVRRMLRAMLDAENELAPSEYVIDSVREPQR